VAAIGHQLRREAPVVQEHAEALLALAAEHGFPFWLAGGAVLRGWSLAAQDAREEGLAQLRRGLADWQATGARTHRPYHLALLAEALDRQGQSDEGLLALDEGLTAAEATHERFYAADLHRLRGELLLKAAGPSIHPEVEGCFRQALALAREQGALSLELRAVLSLARLGPTAEARALLAETYGRFAEGFETSDLKEARELLADLPD
jgi:predicted ATPase